MIKKIGSWGGSLSIRLGNEFNYLDMKQGDNVNVHIEDNKIIIESIKPTFKANGVKFSVRE